MVRMLFACTMVGLVAVTAGCSMCAHPFDDCFPLATSGCGGQACVGPRAGTIRNPADPVTGSGVVLTSGEEAYYEEIAPVPMSSAPVAPMPQDRVRAMNSESRIVGTGRPAASVTGPHVDVRQSIPEAAQILSVTDETLAEAQARKADSSLAAEQPTPAAPRTAQRWSGVQR